MLQLIETDSTFYMRKTIMKSKPPSKKHHRTVMSAFAVTDSKRTAKGKKSSKNNLDGYIQE